jgi:hypothetical protein
MRLKFCALCGCDDPSALEHHHFIPRIYGGTDDEWNIFTVCGLCHGKIHAIPRPLRLGELVKDGLEKIEDRDSKEQKAIIDKRQTQLENAQRLAETIIQKEKIEKLKLKATLQGQVTKLDGNLNSSVIFKLPILPISELEKYPRFFDKIHGFHIRLIAGPRLDTFVEC